MDSSPLVLTPVLRRLVRHSVCTLDALDIAALHQVNHTLGDVYCVFADTLNRIGHPHRIERRGNQARILHHEGSQNVRDGAKFNVHRPVLSNDTHGLTRIQASKGVERIMQQRTGAARYHAHHVVMIYGYPPPLLQVARGASNLDGLIADLFQLDDDLNGRHHGAQLFSGWMAP